MLWSLFGHDSSNAAAAHSNRDTALYTKAGMKPTEDKRIDHNKGEARLSKQFWPLVSVGSIGDSTVATPTAYFVVFLWLLDVSSFLLFFFFLAVCSRRCCCLELCVSYFFVQHFLLPSQHCGWMHP